MSYQQPPDDPYNQQTRASWPSQPSYPPPPQGQQGSYQQQSYQQPQPQPQQQQPQQQQQYYGSADAQNAWPQQNQPSAQAGYQAGGQPSYQAQPATAGYQVQPATGGYQAPGYQVQAQGSRGGHRQGGKQYGLRGAESVWYVIFCIYLGAAYFAKIPSKKAACEIFSELQLDGQGPSLGYSLNGWESFWYILMCLAFGSGYFQKVWAKKSLWEMVNMMRAAPADQIQALTRALTGSGSGSAQYPQRF